MNAKFRQWIRAEIKPFLNFTKVILYAKFQPGLSWNLAIPIRAQENRARPGGPNAHPWFQP